MAIQQQEGFINNVREDEIISALKQMKRNALYLTEPTYRGNAEKWPNNQISFIDYHIAYLKSHPQVNPDHYIANLKLVFKKKI